MSITVEIDEDTAIEMLVDRVKYWTDDNDTIELFEQYYTNMVEGGCFDGGEFNVMSIVDNDYVNNTSITTREDFEKDREEYIAEQLADRLNELTDEEVTEEEKQEALEQYENETITWDDLECGNNTCEFLSGYCIEAKTDNCLLISY